MHLPIPNRKPSLRAAAKSLFVSLVYFIAIVAFVSLGFAAFVAVGIFATAITIAVYGQRLWNVARFKSRLWWCQIGHRKHHHFLRIDQVNKHTGVGWDIRFIHHCALCKREFTSDGRHVALRPMRDLTPEEKEARLTALKASLPKGHF